MPFAARGSVVGLFRRMVRACLSLCLVAGMLVVAMAGPASASDPLTFLRMVGRPRLGAPEGVATDGSGNVYVIDPYSISSLSDDQLVKFDADGVFQDVIAGPGDGLCSGVPCGEVDDPTAVAIAPSGDIYVVQQGSTFDRVERFDALGNFLLAWGGAGTGNGQFTNPQGIAVDSTGDVYVADTFSSGGRIEKFDPSGSYITQWPSGGAAGLAFDPSDNLYVAGGGNLRVYNTSGVQQTSWASSGAAGVAIDGTGNVWVTSSANVIRRYDSVGNPLTNVGSAGNGNGQFSNPQGIAITAGGEVYVADANNGRVQRFSDTGSYETQWGHYPDAGVLDQPSGIAVDASGNTYVTNKTEDVIQKFGPSGSYLLDWGGTGSTNGLMKDPAAVAVGPSGNVYVADTVNQRIQVFDGSGTYLSQFASFGDCSTSCSDGQVDGPAGIVVDGSGNVYVADTLNDRVEKFDPSGNFLLKWGSTGTGDTQFRAPRGLAIDGSGNVWVADSSNNKVKEFSAAGTWIRTIGGAAGSADGLFRTPTDLEFDADGTLWVLDKVNDRFQRFTLTGGFLSKMGSQGLDTGQFDAPTGIAINPAGQLLVADTNNNRVQAFYDANGPDTTILSAPPTLASSTTATFTFQADEPGATFECKLDSGVYATCASGDSFPGNSEGAHLFSVRATDPLANVGNPATYSWTVDTAPPVVTMDSTPAALSTSTSAAFSFHSSEAGTFRCSLDSAVPSACSSPDSFTVSATSHAFDVWAVDTAGNQSTSPASFSFTVDTTPPTVTFIETPPTWSLSANATFKFDAPQDQSATFQCHLDNLQFSSCASPKTYTALQPGQHTFYVRGIDALNNMSTPIHKAWTVDTGTHRPDGLIAAGGTFAGNNVYNTTGTKQTKTQSTKNGTTVTFQVKVENDGNESDTYSILGSASSKGYAVSYYIGTTDVTTKVKAGTYQFPLGQGQAKLITVRVAVSKSPATSKTILLTARSLHDPAKSDAVKAIVKRL